MLGVAARNLSAVFGFEDESGLSDKFHILALLFDQLVLR